VTRWLRRLFWLAVISGAAFGAWTALQRRNEPAAPSSAAPPPPPPAAPPTTPPKFVRLPVERWMPPVDGKCPDGYPIKVGKSGIYHVPGSRSYDRTTADRCYMNADDAEADGYRRAKA
jgi:hypothetical protein